MIKLSYWFLTDFEFRRDWGGTGNHPQPSCLPLLSYDHVSGLKYYFGLRAKGINESCMLSMFQEERHR